MVNPRKVNQPKNPPEGGLFGWRAIVKAVATIFRSYPPEEFPIIPELAQGIGH